MGPALGVSSAKSERKMDGVQQGYDDLRTGLLQWRLWDMLAWHDIRALYRRSKIGPLWMTLSIAIFIGLLGLLYSRIGASEIAKNMCIGRASVYRALQG